MFRAVLSLTHLAQETLAQEHCPSTVNQQHLLSEHSSQHWFQSQKNQTLYFPIITGTGPGEVRREGKTLCSFRKWLLMRLFGTKKKPRRSKWASVPFLPLLQFPCEILGKLLSFSGRASDFPPKPCPMVLIRGQIT